MKEFNPKTASLRTIYRKIEEFWQDKSSNKPYTLNDLTNKFNLSASEDMILMRAKR
ncbi:hypothetical protein [Spiroplasma poulsonii]|uniref:hypothetical protein n=1 Tax=Spiroplasma poulsonii TaxID=2138 RepID=UPI00133158A4|nr:hypothetical protein [Spiroplasma poulsonii]KAF0849838.1 P58 [Spiroplasma poulsonii]